MLISYLIGSPSMEVQSTFIDLHGCDKSLLNVEGPLKAFPKKLCKVIKMVPHGKTIIDRFAEGELEGYSAMQFIETSSITVHLDEFTDQAFIDICSCKEFNAKSAEKFAKEYFRAKRSVSKTFFRK